MDYPTQQDCEENKKKYVDNKLLELEKRIEDIEKVFKKFLKGKK